MKNLNFNMEKWFSRSVVTSLVLFFLFSMNLSAQHYPNLVSDAQARTMLKSEIPHQESLMNGATQGTNAHSIAERRFNMYVHTWELLTNGSTIQEALDQTYLEYAAQDTNESMDFDEFQGEKYKTVDYGDAAFDELVTFLRN